MIDTYRREIFISFPFASYPIIHRLSLGTTNPCTNAVHMETFPTSVFKVLIWIVATTTKISTECRSKWTYVHSPSLQSHLPTQRNSISLDVIRWTAWALSIFGAGRFGRWVVTHSLADFDFHDHRPAVKIDQRPLWYLMSNHFSTFIHRQVHPSSPVLLTKNGPLRLLITCTVFYSKPVLHRFKVWE